jgi:hypothetical protein
VLSLEVAAELCGHAGEHGPASTCINDALSLSAKLSSEQRERMGKKIARTAFVVGTMARTAEPDISIALQLQSIELSLPLADAAAATPILKRLAALTKVCMRACVCVCVCVCQ